MRVSSLFPLIILLLLTGCSRGKYHQMDKMVRQKEYDRAIRAYLNELEPHLKNGIRYIYYDREVVTRIGQTYWHMNRFNPATQILNMVSQKEPDFGMAYFYLGLSYEGLEQYDKAILTYAHYKNLSFDDAYRAILKGRHDWALRYYSERLVLESIKNELLVDLQALSKKKIAVLNFIHLSHDRKWEPLQKGLSYLMIHDLSKIKEIEVIDRITVLTLEELLRQTKSEFLENLANQRIAKLLNVGTLIKGSYLVMDDLRITLDANINFPTQSVQPDMMSYDGNLMRLFMMEKEIIFSILDQLDIELDIQTREELLELPTESLDAFIEFCQGLSALDEYKYDKAQKHFQKAVILDNQFKLAEEWIITPKLWELTHNQNAKRVHYEITSVVQTTSKGRGRIIYEAEPDLLSTYYRLQWMGIRQGALLLPGNDNREASAEVYESGITIFPEMLAEPPAPVGNQ